MKKSTLITTIAMIVVVVVALSTATYAWFTTSRQSVATTTITVQSSSDWTIQKGTVAQVAGEGNENKGTVTFDAGGDTITFDASLARDVWAPNQTTAIVSKPDSNAGTNIGVTKTPWLSAKQKGTGASTVYYGTAMETVFPDMLRVINTKSSNPQNDDPDQKTLTLTIVVNMGPSPSEATKYAANSLTFYVASTTSVFTNGYNLPTSAISATNSSISNEGPVANSNPGAAVAQAASNVTLTGAAQNVYKPAYAGTNLSGIYTTALADNEALALQTNDVYFTYTMTIGTVGYQQGINLAVYTWIDGYSISDVSLGSSLTINYAFS